MATPKRAIAKIVIDIKIFGKAVLEWQKRNLLKRKFQRQEYKFWNTKITVKQ